MVGTQLSCRAPVMPAVPLPCRGDKVGASDAPRAMFPSGNSSIPSRERRSRPGTTSSGEHPRATSTQPSYLRRGHFLYSSRRHKGFGQFPCLEAESLDRGGARSEQAACLAHPRFKNDRCRSRGLQRRARSEQLVRSVEGARRHCNRAASARGSPTRDARAGCQPATRAPSRHAQSAQLARDLDLSADLARRGGLASQPLDGAHEILGVRDASLATARLTALSLVRHAQLGDECGLLELRHGPE